MGNPFSSLQRFDHDRVDEFNFPQHKIQGNIDGEVDDEYAPSQIDEEDEDDMDDLEDDDQDYFDQSDTIFDNISFKNVEIVKQNVSVSNSLRSMDSMDEISSVSTAAGSSSPTTPKRRQRSRTVSSVSASASIPSFSHTTTTMHTARSPRTPHTKRKSVFFSYNSPAVSNGATPTLSPTVETVITELHSKILILGETKSGKSCLRKYYTDGYSISSANSSEYKPTIGVEYGQKTVSLLQELLDTSSLLQSANQESLESVFLKLQFWDLSGKESFLLTNFYYKNANAAIFVFDLSHGITALKQSVEKWKKDLDSKMNMEKLPCILLGNKSDLMNKQSKEYEILQKEIENFCEEYDFARYFEISIKTQQNLDKAMQVLLKLIYEIHFQTSMSNSVKQDEEESILSWNVFYRTEEYQKLAGNLQFFKKENRLQFESITQGYFDKKLCKSFSFEPSNLIVKYDPVYCVIILKNADQKLYLKFLQTNHLLSLVSELNLICQNDTFYCKSIDYVKDTIKIYKYYCVKLNIPKDNSITKQLNDLSDTSVLKQSFANKTNQITPLFESIKWNPLIDTLSLQNNQFSIKHIQSIISCIYTNSTIRSLYLDGNSLNKAMISCLTQYLLSHGKLQLLSLRHCQLNDSLVVPLLASLKLNKRLQELDLSNNEHIQMKTIYKICDLELIKDAHIRLINLSKTSIELDLAKKVLEMEYSKCNNKSKLIIDIGILIQNTFQPLVDVQEEPSLTNTHSASQSSMVPKLKSLSIEIVNKNSFEKIEKLSETNDTQVWKVSYHSHVLCCKELTLTHFNYEQLNAIKQLLHEYQSMIHPLLVPFTAISFDYKEHKCSVLYPSHQYSLFDVLHKKELYGIATLTMQQKLFILKEICCALSFLYSRAQSHFGIKSSNIMVDFEESIKVYVGDYGFNKNSKLMEKLLGSGVRHLPANGIYYVAPEKIKSMRITSELVDVYAFAILMHEIYFEEIPFEKTNLFEKPTQLLHEVAFNNVRPLIPKEDYKKHAEYFQLMERCWHRDKNERFPFFRIEQELELLMEKYKTE